MDVQACAGLCFSHASKSGFLTTRPILEISSVSNVVLKTFSQNLSFAIFKLLCKIICRQLCCVNLAFSEAKL